MPVSLGRGFTNRCFVDAYHAGELVTRRSRTGYVVILSNVHILSHGEDGLN